MFVISGPSGVGKGTVLKSVLEEDENLVFSVSCTTRKPREGETDGKEYFFKSREEFQRMIEEDRFLEWAHVHEKYYGTPRSFVEEKLNAGQDMVLDIDVQGAFQVMKSRPHSTFVFIAPPDLSVDVLRQRLQGRKTETREQMEGRLKTAETELKQAPLYQYIVFNDNVEEAVRDIKAIIRAERCKAERFFPEHKREIPKK